MSDATKYHKFTLLFLNLTQNYVLLMVPTDHVFSIFKSDLTRKAAEPYCFRVNALLLPPARDFPGPDSQFKNEENGVYQSQFISSTFW